MKRALDLKFKRIWVLKVKGDAQGVPHRAILVPSFGQGCHILSPEFGKIHHAVNQSMAVTDSP